MRFLLLALVTVALFASPAIAAQGDFHFVEGTVTFTTPPGSATDSGTLVVKGDDGRSYNISTQGLSTAERTFTVGERVSVAAREGGSADRLNALAVEHRGAATASGQPSQPAQPDHRGARDWKRVHGKVESVTGTSMRFKADDGRSLDVDLARVSSNVQTALDPNEGATIVGFEDARSGRFHARYVQQDSSDPSRKAAAVAVDEQAWQKIRGTVQSVDGNKMVLRTDDNRTLNVDMASVSSSVRSNMQKGGVVTVTGHYHGDQNNVNAQYIQAESSPSASPTTK